MRIESEEWKVETIHREDDGVVTLYSNGAKQYLGSLDSGKAFLTDKPDDQDCFWVIEEGECGFAIVSHRHQRILVSSSSLSNNETSVGTTITTVKPGTFVQGTTRWILEPKLPRRVNKEKIQAVGAAVVIGVATSVVTPFVIGGAIGIVGVAQVGVAGQVAIGSIRTAETLSTLARLTLSSSELVSRQSSMMRKDGDSSIVRSNSIPFQVQS